LDRKGIGETFDHLRAELVLQGRCHARQPMLAP
jgi:hypothetical protein